MKRRYLIYWDAPNGVHGNVIMNYNKNKTDLKGLVREIIKSLNEEDPSIKRIVIKFMVELK